MMSGRHHVSVCSIVYQEQCRFKVSDILSDCFTNPYNKATESMRSFSFENVLEFSV